MGIKFEHTASKLDSSGDKSNVFNREIHLFGEGFSAKAKEDFYGELSVLLHSGINLKSALDLISEMQSKTKHKKLLEQISEKIMEGSSLSKALEVQNGFSSYEVQALKIGEQTGKLPKITEDLRAYFNRKNEHRRQLISSLSYPIIVLITAILVVFFMLSYVVPMFVDIFKQNRVELPWITEQIVKLSNLISGNGLLIFLGVVVVIIGIRFLSKTDGYHKLIGKIQLKIPVLGNYLKKIYLIQFTQAMALLSNAKIPVVNGVHLTRKMIHFYPLERSLEIIEGDLIRGEKLHSAFAKHTIYEKKMIALLKVAEETNQTEYIFQKLYDGYSMELKHKGQIIANVFNFLLTLFVGIIVGIILVAMYLPMFKLSSVIG